MDDLQPYLTRHGIHAALLDLGIPMPTATASAAALHVPLAQIFKSLVLTPDDGITCAVAVLAGDARLNPKALSKLLSWQRARFASPDTVLEKTGYPAGGTPPLGHRHPLPILLDRTLFQHPIGYAGGGRHELLLRITPAELQRATAAPVVDISLPPASPQ